MIDYVVTYSSVINYLIHNEVVVCPKLAAPHSYRTNHQ
jgi:hypothetical protein